MLVTRTSDSTINLRTRDFTLNSGCSLAAEQLATGPDGEFNEAVDVRNHNRTPKRIEQHQHLITSARTSRSINSTPVLFEHLNKYKHPKPRSSLRSIQLGHQKLTVVPSQNRTVHRHFVASSSHGHADRHDGASVGVQVKHLQIVID